MKTQSSLLIAAALAAWLAPSAAEAARCKQGSIYRPSQGVCVSKASAMRAGIYRPRIAKASIRYRHRTKKPPVIKQARGIPALACDYRCELALWAAKNRGAF